MEAQGKTIVLPIPPGQPLPDLPAAGIGAGDSPDVQQIDRPQISPGPNPSTYLFTEIRIQRNLFRIPLH
jgi:hypothetical protein